MKIILDALGCDRAELSLLLTDDAEIRLLNRDWLGRDRPTDIIAFSQLEGPPCPTDFIGDVVISGETAARQAKEHGHSPERELDLLLAHGILHLLGYDHAAGGPQARKMRTLQNRLLAALAREEPA